jgi:pimeloyl-ACP methyl ester carboxylesterase
MPRAGIPVELCRVETDDGHILDGALYGSAAIKTGVTFVVVHGTGSNFYSPGPLETFALLASQAGHAACRVNTQGHDGMAGIPGRNGTTPGGAAFEKAADGGKDVAAWVRHFASLGADRIVLVGHSMGGLKSLLAARELATENLVDAVVCFSPPWLSHEHWMWHPAAKAFRETMALAKEAVRNGEGETLIRCRQPLPIVTTAAGFCEKYGPDSPLDLIKLLPDVDCPVLVTVGENTLGSSPAFDGVSEALGQLSKNRTHLEVQIVPGENMSYSMNPDRPFALTSDWLKRNGI